MFFNSKLATKNNKSPIYSTSMAPVLSESTLDITFRTKASTCPSRSLGTPSFHLTS